MLLTLNDSNIPILFCLWRSARPKQSTTVPIVLWLLMESSPQKEGAIFPNATSNPKRINAHINWYRENIPLPDELVESHFWPSRKARVTAPTLYIWGEDDPIYNEVALNRLVALSDQSRVMTISGIGHWPHVREAGEVNRAIVLHIQEASASNPN